MDRNIHVLKPTGNETQTVQTLVLWWHTLHSCLLLASIPTVAKVGVWRWSQPKMRVCICPPHPVSARHRSTRARGNNLFTLTDYSSLKYFPTNKKRVLALPYYDLSTYAHRLVDSGAAVAVCATDGSDWAKYDSRFGLITFFSHCYLPSKKARMISAAVQVHFSETVELVRGRLGCSNDHIPSLNPEFADVAFRVAKDPNNGALNDTT